jgi:RNA polymerase sigma-70 factor (ECF subfamily)
MDKDGSVRNLADLVERHYALLYRYAYRLSGSAADAEDLTQQAFLTAQRRFPQLRDLSRAKAWLCAIVRNTYLKGLRATKGVSLVSLDRIAEQSDTGPIDSFVDQEQLQLALNELPEAFRTPLIWFYFEDFSYKEIAERMELPIGTVMSRLARGKAHLRAQLSSPPTAAKAERYP